LIKDNRHYLFLKSHDIYPYAKATEVEPATPAVPAVPYAPGYPGVDVPAVPLAPPLPAAAVTDMLTD
jgi:hypothetical protein